MADVAASLRTRYASARASEIVTEALAQELQGQIDSLQGAVNKTRSVQRSASAAAETLRGLAKDVEIDLSDETMGKTLEDEIARQRVMAEQSLGLSRVKTPKGPPVAGRIIKPGERGAQEPQDPPPATPAAPAAPRIAVREGTAPPSNGAAPAPSDAPPPPPAPAPTPDAAPPGGKIDRVSARAREAMRRIAKPEAGETGRADALVDPDGRAIPVDEMLTVDDDAPEPGGSRAANESDVAPDAKRPETADKAPGNLPAPTDE